MDGAEVGVNCLCSARSCATCWYPDNELTNAHCECKYRRMAEVMGELDAARDKLLDQDGEEQRADRACQGCEGSGEAPSPQATSCSRMEIALTSC